MFVCDNVHLKQKEILFVYLFYFIIFIFIYALLQVGYIAQKYFKYLCCTSLDWKQRQSDGVWNREKARYPVQYTAEILSVCLSNVKKKKNLVNNSQTLKNFKYTRACVS